MAAGCASCEEDGVVVALALEEIRRVTLDDAGAALVVDAPPRRHGLRATPLGAPTLHFAPSKVSEACEARLVDCRSRRPGLAGLGRRGGGWAEDERPFTGRVATARAATSSW